MSTISSKFYSVRGLVVFTLGLLLFLIGPINAQPRAESGDDASEKSNLLITNVFTPNGDGFNDLFAPNSSQLAGWQIQVFDRWGKRVFNGSENQPWDGKTNNGTAQTGVYVYVLKAVDATGQRIERRGSVTLVR
jgi:gliding motility-associated-like protein